MLAAEELYNGGGAGLSAGYELDFYDQMDKLKDSAELVGYDDGFDYVKDSMRLASNGEIDFTDDYQQKVYGNNNTTTESDDDKYIDNSVYTPTGYDYSNTQGATMDGIPKDVELEYYQSGKYKEVGKKAEKKPNTTMDDLYN